MPVREATVRPEIGLAVYHRWPIARTTAGRASTPMITRTDVEGARPRIAGRVRRTPLAAPDPDTFAGPTWFKLELLQHTGTFKARGAFNRILSAAEQGTLDPEIGVVVASGGNAGLANAYA